MLPSRGLVATTLVGLAASAVPSVAVRQAAAAASPGNAPRVALAAPAACGAMLTTASFAGTSGGLGAAAVPGVTAYTVLVSTPQTYLWDVDLHTAIAHPACFDLDVTLTSPAGTVVTITTDNGGPNANVFNGTVWDDNVNAPVTDFVFANGVTASPLSPEGRLASFRGEDPNGTWTLTIVDDLAGNGGTLASWSLDVSTLAAAPAPSSTTFATSPNLAFGGASGRPSMVSSSIGAAGLGAFLLEVELYVEIPHDWTDDIELLLTSAAATSVIPSTDNGGGLFNTFNGTLFDPDAPATVSDFPYVDTVAAAAVSPEGSFDNFLGQDPNGTWTLRVADDFMLLEDGVFRSWALTLRTIAPPAPGVPTTHSGTGGPIADAAAGVSAGTFTFSASVAGLPAYLWDADLSTSILHTRSSDLDVTLTSPGGTSVTITTDNAAGNDDVFNGTLWDDGAATWVVDASYANGVAQAALKPEGSLAAFRGEDPNGTWTLTIVDDTSGDLGSLTGWSLDLATLASAPSTVTTTLTQSPGLPVGPGAGVNALDTIAAAGLGTSIAEVEVYVVVPHRNAADLDLSLLSPAGTSLRLTTDNGNTNDDVFNGTLFDASSTNAVSDFLFVNAVAATPLSPEDGFDRWIGEDPNGNWTLTVADDAASNGGTLVRWDLTIRTCAPPPVPYCFGDGTGTFCPCSPAPVPHGAAGRGCPTNIFAGGALAMAAGASSISADTLVLTGTDMINGAMIFYQGAIQEAGGAGAVFGDGKRCIQATGIRRFKTKGVVGNTASYPGAGDPAISVAGAVGAPGTRNYQGWYRSANPAFCTSATFNFTNGLAVSWVP